MLASNVDADAFVRVSFTIPRSLGEDLAWRRVRRCGERMGEAGTEINGNEVDCDMTDESRCERRKGGTY